MLHLLLGEAQVEQDVRLEYELEGCCEQGIAVGGVGYPFVGRGRVS